MAKPRYVWVIEFGLTGRGKFPLALLRHFMPLLPQDAELLECKHDELRTIIFQTRHTNHSWKPPKEVKEAGWMLNGRHCRRYEPNPRISAARVKAAETKRVNGIANDKIPIQVNGVRYNATMAAFVARRLPDEHYQWVRMRLRIDGEYTYTYAGKSYHFVAMKKGAFNGDEQGGLHQAQANDEGDDLAP